MKSILEIDQLNKAFGQQIILQDCSFTLTEPQIIALVAPNGTGKTTLLNIIANLENADSGQVRLFGETNTQPKIFTRTAYLQDNSILYNQLTGWDHLAFVAKEQQRTAAEAHALAEELGMTAYLKKKVKKYSLGMKQHLLLALALVGQPKLLLMDEPLNGLDPSSIIQVRQILQRLLKQGVTVIISSHNLHEIEKVTDHVYFLHQGRLVNKDGLLPKTERYELILSNRPLAVSYFQNLDIPLQSLEEYKLQVTLAKEQLTAFQSFCQEIDLIIYDSRKISKDLEDIYFKLFATSTYEVPDNEI